MPAELLDVDVDEFARVFAFVAARAGSAGSSALRRLSPSRLRTRLTVAGDTPTSRAICSPGSRRRRSASILAIAFADPQALG
jgi:hypothetical protein